MKTPTNITQSVRARLLSLSKESGEEFNYMLTRYAIERLLARLAASTHAGAFILKGAMLFGVWSTIAHRTTKETVVAEKLNAMVDRGMANSRMKDFFDLAFLARSTAFDGRTLARAIAATFARRKTPLPAALPVALTPEFFESEAKQKQWTAFVKRVAPKAEPLQHVIASSRRSSDHRSRTPQRPRSST